MNDYWCCWCGRRHKMFTRLGVKHKKMEGYKGETWDEFCNRRNMQSPRNKFACKYCMFEGRPLEMGISVFKTMEALIDHVENHHDIGIVRKGETSEQAIIRIGKTNPRVGSQYCRCPQCKHRMADGDITVKLIEAGLLVPKNNTIYVKEIDEVLPEFMGVF